MVAITFDLDDLPAAFGHNDAASVITIPRADGLDPLLFSCDWSIHGLFILKVGVLIYRLL